MQSLQLKCKLLLLLLLLLLPGFSACGRAFYRKQADKQVYCLVDNVAANTGEAAPDFTIEIDPRSRMYDPNSPDKPPMPPDDPLAHRYMHCVACKKGWPCWHCNGDTPYVANPDWLAYLPVNQKGELLLDLRGAVDVALVNSTDYQEQLEELYLSALDVTFERFRLDTQFYGGSSIFFTADGRNRPGSGGNSSSLLNVSPFDPTNRLRATKMFATGGELVVGMANSIVWQFSGPNAQNTNTLLDFSFVQPLLRMGGRARVLERLTIAERTLLSNIRQMERYRRGFYTEIASGRDSGPGPARRGGFFGGSGLEGFSGVGGGGFGRVGASGTRITATGTGAGAAQAGGYLGLLQTTQEIRNQEANVQALRVSLAQLRAFQAANRLGDRGEIQIGLAASALYNAESRLLTSKAQFQSSLDDFKLNLGLPSSLPLQVQDEKLDQFNLIDPQLVTIQRLVERLLDQTRKLEFARLDQEDAAKAAAGKGELPPPADVPEVDVAALVQAGDALQKEVVAHLETVTSDLRKLNGLADERRANLKRLTARDEARRQDIDPGLLDAHRFDERLAALQIDYKAVLEHFACDWETLQILRTAAAEGRDLTTIEIPCRDRQITTLDPDAPVEEGVVKPAPAALDPALPAGRKMQRDRTPWTTMLTELSRNLLELSLVQARIRTNSINLLPIEITSEQALQIACRNRRDLANARTELVNAWRLIQFNANDLRSGLNLTFNGDMGNLGNNPVKLDASTGRLRVGLQFDAPLTRLAQRNVYRQSLIEYQQARRTYYKIVDRIERGLRESIRAIRLNDMNFELRREAVQVALRRYHLTLLDLDRPASRTQAAGPGQVNEGAQDFGATTARDLVDALSDLQNAQNDFLSVWVNFEVQRLSLDFDLGTMQLDSSGNWIDPGREIGLNEQPPLVYGGHGDYDAPEHRLLMRHLEAQGLGCELAPEEVQAGDSMSELELLQLPELNVPNSAGRDSAGTDSTGAEQIPAEGALGQEYGTDDSALPADPYEASPPACSQQPRPEEVTPEEFSPAERGPENPRKNPFDDDAQQRDPTQAPETEIRLQGHWQQPLHVSPSQAEIPAQFRRVKMPAQTPQNQLAGRNERAAAGFNQRRQGWTAGTSPAVVR